MRKRVRKRVVVMSSGSVLMASVIRLLQSSDGLEVEVIATADLTGSQRISRFAPEAIVLDAGGTPSGHELLGRLLAEHPTARVIALNLDRTAIQVYRGTGVTEASLEGLLGAIRGTHSRPASKAPGRVEGALSRRVGGEATKPKR